MLTLNINLEQYSHAKREIQFIDHELRRYRVASNTNSDGNPFPFTSCSDTRIKLDVFTLLKSQRKIQLILCLESEQLLLKALSLSAQNRLM